MSCASGHLTKFVTELVTRFGQSGWVSIVGKKYVQWTQDWITIIIDKSGGMKHDSLIKN